MAEFTAVDILSNDATFMGMAPQDQHDALVRNGASPEQAAQILIDIARTAPPSPSIMMGERPSTFAAAPLTALGRVAGQVGQQAGPATVGSVVGGIAAPFARIPREIGQAAGGMVGEAARQALTDAPFDLMQIAGAAVAPQASGLTTPIIRGTASRVGLPALADLGATRISPRVTQSVAKRVPGAAGAFADIAQEQVHGIPARIRASISRLVGTTEASGDLIEAGLGAPGLVPMRRTAEALADVRAKDILEGFPLDINEKVLTPLTNFLETSAQAGGTSMRGLNTLRRTVGEFFGEIKSQGPQKDAARKIVAGVLQDLDDAVTAGAPGAQSLRQGLDVARLEFAAQDFEELVENVGLGIIRQGERNPVFRINRVLTELEKVRRGNPSRKMELFSGAFKGDVGKQELDDIINLVGDLNETVLALPPPPGVQAGSSQGLVAGAGGAALAPVLGMSPAMGAAVGIGTKNILTRLLMSKAGRDALKQTLLEGAEVDLLEATGIFLGNLAQQELLGGRTEALAERFAPAQLSAP